MHADEYRAKAAACLLGAESLKDPNTRAGGWQWLRPGIGLADETERMQIHDVLSRDRDAA